MMKIRFIIDLIITNFIYSLGILFCFIVLYETKCWELGFIFVPFIVITLYYAINSTKRACVEYKVIKKLVEFNSINQGLRHLEIAKDMVKKFEKIDDILYANRINIMCCEVIEKKLYSMGYKNEN